MHDDNDDGDENNLNNYYVYLNHKTLFNHPVNFKKKGLTLPVS